MNDALGQPLVIGNVYGYSISAGSTITVVTGKLVKINAKKVTLEVLSRKYFLYGEPTECGWAGQAPTTNVSSPHLFPVVTGS